MDGSLTGHVGGWVTPSSELHPPQYCNQLVMPFSVGSFPGSVCTSEVYFIRLAWNQVRPLVCNSYVCNYFIVGINCMTFNRVLSGMLTSMLSMNLV